jgi:hypothetical protein
MMAHTQSQQFAPGNAKPADPLPSGTVKTSTNNTHNKNISAEKLDKLMLNFTDKVQSVQAQLN